MADNTSNTSLNPMLMFHVNFMNALAALTEKNAVSFQVLSFPGSTEQAKELAYESLCKTNRAIEMVLNDLERKFSPGFGRPVLNLVKTLEEGTDA